MTRIEAELQSLDVRTGSKAYETDQNNYSFVPGQQDRLRLLNGCEVDTDETGAKDLRHRRSEYQSEDSNENKCQGNCCRAEDEREESGNGKKHSDRSARKVERDARRAERKSRKDGHHSRRSEQRQPKNTPVEGSSKDVYSVRSQRRSGPVEGNSREHSKSRRIRDREHRRGHESSLNKQLAKDPEQITPTVMDYQTAIGHAERQRKEASSRLLQLRLQALNEATRKRREAEVRNGNNCTKVLLVDTMLETDSRPNACRERRKNRKCARELLEVTTEVPERDHPDVIRERERAHAARIRERKESYATKLRERERILERERQQEAARELEEIQRAEAELQLQVEQERVRQLEREERARINNLEAMGVMEERAIAHVRAAERERQILLLQSPQSAYRARTSPPPRDEYSTIDEDIPPYRALLHKYLDLVAYDERFVPVLRVNTYLIGGDSELTAAIDKFTRFNLLPKKTDLWCISHVDDDDFEQMIPELIPDQSYYGNELDGF